MTEGILLKMIIGAFITLAFGLNAKIIWDWCTNRNKRVLYKDCNATIQDVEELKDKLNLLNDIILSIRPKLEKISKDLELLSKTVIGNGSIQNSVVYRLAAAEEKIKNIKESRSI